MDLWIPEKLIAKITNKDYSGIGETGKTTVLTIEDETKPIMLDRIKKGFLEKVSIEAENSKIELDVKEGYHSFVLEFKNGGIRLSKKAIPANEILFEKRLDSI